jgi:hypothetical protein
MHVGVWHEKRAYRSSFCYSKYAVCLYFGIKPDGGGAAEVVAAEAL